MRVWLVALTFLLAGCSSPDTDDPDGMDGDGMDGDGMDGDGMDGNGTGIMEPGFKTWNISISGNDFEDGSITIQVGDTVRWVHEDGATPHTVTADDGTFDSGTGPTDFMTAFSNSEYEYTFTAAGEFPYHCEVHPMMTDTITVVEPGAAT